MEKINEEQQTEDPVEKIQIQGSNQNQQINKDKGSKNDKTGKKNKEEQKEKKQKQKQNIQEKTTDSDLIKSSNQDSQENQEESNEDGFVVTMEKVEGRVNYKRLIEKFGTEEITETLLEKFKRVTGKDLHPWLTRNIFFSHRDLDEFLTAYENGDPVFLYTGRGPSSDSMHIGHLIPFMFTKWLQDAFDCPLVIQLSDEEKYAFGKGSFELLHQMGFENAKDIVAVGFRQEKTFIFSNRDYRLKCPEYEIFTSTLKVNASVKEVMKVFGFSEDGNIGMLDWPFYQTAASFSQAFPHIFGGRPAYCLIPCAIDQDSYFRLGRDLAQRLNLLKTATIYCTFLPPLKGLDLGKMSSSVGQEATLFLNDEPKVIERKIKTYAKSGSRGNGSLEDHKKLGGDVDEDISCQYLRYFEMDEEKLQNDLKLFSEGVLTCSDMKVKLAEKLMQKFKEVQDKRKEVSDDYLLEFYKIKPIALPKVKEKEKNKDQISLEDFLTSNSIPFIATYHNPILSLDGLKELKSKFEGTICRTYLLYGQDKFYIAVFHVDTNYNKDNFKKTALNMKVKKLNFATKDNSTHILHCDISFASLLGLIFANDLKSSDNSRLVSEVWIDNKITSEKVSFPAIRNDAHITIKFSDMINLVRDILKFEVKITELL